MTNLTLPSRAVVRFYNKRGTAEQWIKEGKQAVKMTRLSCHRFRSNEVRLWLSVIAYNLGQPVAALGAAQQNRELVADEPAAAVGEDGRQAGQACPLLLVVVGGESSDAAAVWQHGAANLGATAACGLTETARQEEKFINNEIREAEVSEKSLRAAAVPGGKGQ